MIKRIPKLFINCAIAVIIGVFLGISLQTVKAWSNPTDTPPLGNLGAPINIGDAPQTKLGILSVPEVKDTNTEFGNYDINPSDISHMWDVYAESWVEAPRFYDTSDVTFYVAPTVGSVMNSATTGTGRAGFGGPAGNELWADWINFQGGAGIALNVGNGSKTDTLGTLNANKLCLGTTSEDATNCLTAESIGGQWTTNGNNIYNSNSGNVGIGTNNPAEGKLSIYQPTITKNGLFIDKPSSATIFGQQFANLYIANTDPTPNNFAKINFGKGPTGGAASIAAVITDHNNSYAHLGFWTRDAAGIGERLHIDSGGNVGIGLSSGFTSKLDVLNTNDNILSLKRQEGASITSANFRVGTDGAMVIDTNTGTNNSVTVSGDLNVLGKLNVSGADVAEEFATTEELDLGTVVVMNDGGVKTAKPSETKYDQKVIGVVSDNPSVVMGKISDKTKAVIAMVGVVKVKVTTQNGNIEKGDLLATSDLKGHAMKATEEKVGTVIGKALENFSGNTGEITALINLQ
jgi:hypothetical protein